MTRSAEGSRQLLPFSVFCLRNKALYAARLSPENKLLQRGDLMIRFIFIALFLILYLILSCPIMLILLLVRKINAKKADQIMQRIVQCALSIVWHMAGVKVTTLGLDNIPEDQAVLFTGNHQSFFDILVLLANLDKPHAILSKASIGKVPLIRLWMKEIHCVYVDRADMKAGIEAINKMIEVINTLIKDIESSSIMLMVFIKVVLDFILPLIYQY